MRVGSWLGFALFGGFGRMGHVGRWRTCLDDSVWDGFALSMGHSDEVEFDIGFMNLQVFVRSLY